MSAASPLFWDPPLFQLGSSQYHHKNWPPSWATRTSADPLCVKYWSSVLLLRGCSILLDHQSSMEWEWKEVEEALTLRFLVTSGIIMRNHQENLIRLQLIHSKLWYLRNFLEWWKISYPRTTSLKAKLENVTFWSNRRRETLVKRQ